MNTLDSATFDKDVLEEILAAFPHHPSQLVVALQNIQSHYHYLPDFALQRVAEVLDIDLSTIMSVATFYNQFRLTPAGKHHIHVCVGTACHVAGADTLLQAFKKYLQIPDQSDTDSQRQFTISPVACLGCCMMAPVVQIGSQIYGWVKPDQVQHVTTDFLTRQQSHPPIIPVMPSLAIPLARIQICRCSSCIAAGADAVYDELAIQIANLQLPAYLVEVSCLGISYQSPLVEIILHDGTRHCYGRISSRQVRTMLLDHLRPIKWKRRLHAWFGKTLEKLVSDSLSPSLQAQRLEFTVPGSTIPSHSSPDVQSSPDLYNTSQTPETNYIGPQKWLALEHAGQLSPLDIQQYRNTGGFTVLEHILRYGSQDRVIAQIQASGLRGRGGAGFPTAQKWTMVRQTPSDIKYIIANGDEGDPGAFMNRLILECFPFKVLEGIIIAAWCVGACQGYLYIRAEYPLAVTRIRQALEICQKQGYLGSKILGTTFDLELQVIPGAGAFVCGEETALIAAIEGRPGRPRYRPPYPAQQGLWQKPTLINNVETYSLVPWILRNGAESFAQIGTATSKGTKSFALAGKIQRGGLIEVQMGISLRQIVEQIGGGVKNGTWKAVQIGGPSGGCIPAALCDIPVDYQELTRLGAMMGSGGLVVLDDHDCMVDIAKYFLSFTQQESCGKCSPCRIGTKRMLEILDRICNKKGTPADLAELERLANLVQRTSLCGLGKSAPNPVLSTLRYYREEYEAHLQGRCPAKHCTAFIEYRVNSRCIGCTRCSQQCVFGAISPQPYQRQKIDNTICTRCDRCRQVCPVGAIEVVSCN